MPRKENQTARKSTGAHSATREQWLLKQLQETLEKYKEEAKEYKSKFLKMRQHHLNLVAKVEHMKGTLVCIDTPLEEEGQVSPSSPDLLESRGDVKIE